MNIEQKLEMLERTIDKMRRRIMILENRLEKLDGITQKRPEYPAALVDVGVPY